MKKSAAWYTESDREVLRRGLKSRYKDYHLKDKVTYPDFEYNSNRVNYEPLKDSFIEEFFVLRGIDRVENNLHIPSTSTLVQLFCDDEYVPTKKILNTCRAYAEGAAEVALTADEPRIIQVEEPSISKINSSSKTTIIFAVAISFAVLVGLLVYLLIKHQSALLSPSGLTIERPINGETVPMEVVIKGKVSNANTVWLVARSVGGLRYWVQPPVGVERDGTWKRIMFIDEENVPGAGLKSQIRAFVNPYRVLKANEALYSWPEAQLSSQVVEVVRGSKIVPFPQKLTINRPANSDTVSRELFVEGKVSNAPRVWLVVLATKDSAYYVQPPIDVENNGTWKGGVYIGGRNKADIGARYQIRAFVNSSNPLREGEVLNSWPEAQLSSAAVDVVRGTKID